MARFPSKVAIFTFAQPTYTITNHSHTIVYYNNALRLVFSVSSQDGEKLIRLKNSENNIV